MKKLFLFLASLAILASCANQSGVYRPNPITGKLEPVVIVADYGDDAEKIRAKKEFLATQAAIELTRDPSLNTTEKLVAAAIPMGADVVRALVRLLRANGISLAPTGSPTTDTTAPAFTEVQKKLISAGFIFERGKLYAPKNLDPARQTPINEEEAILIYKYKNASDYGPAKPLIDSIRAKY